MLNRISKKKVRKEQARTFVAEKEVPPKENKEDEAQKLHAKYFL